MRRSKDLVGDVGQLRHGLIHLAGAALRQGSPVDVGDEHPAVGQRQRRQVHRLADHPRVEAGQRPSVGRPRRAAGARLVVNFGHLMEEGGDELQRPVEAQQGAGARGPPSGLVDQQTLPLLVLDHRLDGDVAVADCLVGVVRLQDADLVADVLCHETEQCAEHVEEP